MFSQCLFVSICFIIAPVLFVSAQQLPGRSWIARLVTTNKKDSSSGTNDGTLLSGIKKKGGGPFASAAAVVATEKGELDDGE